MPRKKCFPSSTLVQKVGEIYLSRVFITLRPLGQWPEFFYYGGLLWSTINIERSRETYSNVCRRRRAEIGSDFERSGFWNRPALRRSAAGQGRRGCRERTGLL